MIAAQDARIATLRAEVAQLTAIGDLRRATIARQTLARLQADVNARAWTVLFLGTTAGQSQTASVLLPAAATTVAENYRDRGYDVAICYDDLSKHAKAYRQTSLLIGKRPGPRCVPGRCLQRARGPIGAGEARVSGSGLAPRDRGVRCYLGPGHCSP